jgi:hypothetical protein
MLLWLVNHYCYCYYFYVFTIRYLGPSLDLHPLYYCVTLHDAELGNLLFYFFLIFFYFF